MKSVSQFARCDSPNFSLSAFFFCLGVIVSSSRCTAQQGCLFEDSCLPAACDASEIPFDSCCAYDSCWSTDRTTLTGDWGGARTGLAESGINFQADLTQFYFGVVNGGLEKEFRYSGHGDYVLNVDAGKLGLQQGLFVKIRAEHRFGEGITDATGSFLPNTVQGDLPTLESEELLLTNVLFTQALSENFVVFAGKLDTLDGDVNAFAHGRGKTQFSNVAFVATPIALRTVPYSSLGMGFAWLKDGEPIFNFTLMNPTDTVSTTGFDELFEEGVAMAAELRLPTRFFNRPGHQLFAGSWSNRDYVSLGQDPRIILPNIPIARSSGSWSLYWNFDQYLMVDPCDETKGWGIFGRAGIADDDTNPISYFLSFGLGGNSQIPGRSDDTFGAGWYYSATSDEIGPILSATLGPVGDGQGLEFFYRTQIRPWFHITPDLQVVLPARDNVDASVVVGLRSNISF